jgi:hypothetical protein
MLAINLWDRKPKNISYHDNKILVNNLINSKNNYDIFNKIINNISLMNNSFTSIEVSNKIINFDFFEQLLYNREQYLFLKFGEFISLNDIEHSFQIIRNNDYDKNKIQQELKTKYGNIIDDINAIMDENNVIRYNRFLQRFQYPKIFTHDICKWIINESENYAHSSGGWTKNRHNNYPTTDLPIDNIKSIFPFMIETFRTISIKIKNSYNLSDDIKINFVDVFVVKYKFNEQNYLEIHKDGSFLSFNILLSNPNDFDGGGTYFDDGLIMKPDQGDLIIHSSKIKHSGLPITKGTRYLLVGFINLNLFVNNSD